MRWIKQDTRPHQTALAMVGAKPGQQVLVIGAGNGRLAAALAGVTGLNGRTLVVDASAGAETAVNAAAADAGALVEFAQGTCAQLESGGSLFDIVVVHRRLTAPNVDRGGILDEAARVVRPGGRVVVIEGKGASGWRGLLQKPGPPAISGASVCDLLTAAGLLATRVLAESEGVTYVEGARRPGSGPMTS